VHLCAIWIFQPVLSFVGCGFFGIVVARTMEGGVINQGSSYWPVRLTAAVIRGNTKLRVRIDRETQCVCIEMDGTPCPILLGVTPSGAETLRKAISTGLAELASQQPSAEQTTADTHD
jgi:hypothetical protein